MMTAVLCAARRDLADSNGFVPGSLPHTPSSVTTVSLISAEKPNARIAAAVALTPRFAGPRNRVVMTLALSGSGACLRIDTFPAALVRLNNASIAAPKDLYLGSFNSSSKSPVFFPADPKGQCRCPAEKCFGRWFRGTDGWNYRDSGIWFYACSKLAQQDSGS